jgi:hypothetical protein
MARKKYGEMPRHPRKPDDNQSPNDPSRHNPLKFHFEGVLGCTILLCAYLRECQSASILEALSRQNELAIAGLVILSLRALSYLWSQGCAAALRAWQAICRAGCYLWSLAILSLRAASYLWSQGCVAALRAWQATCRAGRYLWSQVCCAVRKYWQVYKTTLGL